MNTKTDWKERVERAAGRDITANRHKGNSMSVRAFDKVKDSLPLQRREVLEAVAESFDHGITCRELSDRWGCGMNAVSGRFTELRAAGLIEVDCSRDGCSVYRLSVSLLCPICNGHEEIPSRLGKPKVCNQCQGR